MDKKTEGYFYLQTLQNIVVDLSQSAFLQNKDLNAVEDLLLTINRLIHLWQNDLSLKNGHIIKINGHTRQRILGNSTLIFSHLQALGSNPAIGSDMNWLYFNEILGELNQIIIQFDVMSEN